MIHFVFQFTEGQTIMTSGGPIVSSKANRLIATFDPLNSRLYSSPDFDAYCQEKIKDFDGAIVSGFHLVPYLGFKEIFDQKIGQISSWKEANLDCMFMQRWAPFMIRKLWNTSWIGCLLTVWA